MTNTAIVNITRMVKHPLYHKRYHISKRIKVDNPEGFKEGDIVEIIECRPLSKEKSWKISRLIESKALPEEIKDEVELAAAENKTEESKSEEIEIKEPETKDKKTKEVKANSDKKDDSKSKTKKEDKKEE